MIDLSRRLLGRLFPKPVATKAPFDIDHVKALTLDAFSAPIFIMKNGEIVFANQACCKAFGLQTSDQIVGHHITQRLSAMQPDGLPMRQSLDQFNEAFRTRGFVRRTWSFKRLDGSESIIRSTVARIPHDRYRCSVAIVDDMDAFAAEHASQRSALEALSENGTVKNVADCVNTTATQLMHGAQSLNESSLKATSMLQDALTSTERAAESTSSISSSARRMSAATDLFATRMTEREEQLLEATHKSSNVSQAMALLSTATSRIGEITRLMTAFASQTQLLALNATIEAARAGKRAAALPLWPRKSKFSRRNPRRPAVTSENRLPQFRSWSWMPERLAAISRGCSSGSEPK